MKRQEIPNYEDCDSWAEIVFEDSEWVDASNVEKAKAFEETSGEELGTVAGLHRSVEIL